MQISRELNQYNIEDKQYLAGVANAALGPDELWYGVFLWAKNQTHSPQRRRTRSTSSTPRATTYYPVPIDASVNPYAWTPQILGRRAPSRRLAACASFGPTQGGVVVFKLNNSVYSNRPLTLQIRLPGRTEVAATISLDL